jgi:hypothetical protein
MLPIGTAVAIILWLVAVHASASRAVYGKCNLGDIGTQLANDKVLTHKYHHLYCKTLLPFINGIKDRPIRMLEIGFGCGHHNHGNSALMWHKFFTSNGAKLELWEVDMRNPEHLRCARKFLTEHPPGTVVMDVYLGDQENKDFMSDVVELSGGNYDIIVDDGGHLGEQIRNSFEVLWPALADGGVYVIETLGMMPSNSMSKSFVRDILGWQDQLIGVNHGFKDVSDVGWTKFPSKKPTNLEDIHCRNQICALLKETS